MGVLSDVVVAPEAEAEAVLNTLSDARPWPWADVKGIEPVKLGQLEAVFRGGAYDPDFVEACETLATSDGEESWVFRIPAGLTDHLATTEPDAVRRVASQWAAAEEFALDGWEPEEVEKTLVELVRLARLARGTGAGLLLWMSL